MKAWFALIAAAVLVALVTTSGTIGTVMPKGIPIKELGDGKPHPEILLIEPLPGWIPLPDSGSAISAGVYPPQPPYGAAAVIMVMTDDSSADFAADYGRRLDRAGFSVRRIPIQFNLIIDKPDAQFEADERDGGHVVYITMRHTRVARFAQLTFWDPPAPHP